MSIASRSERPAIPKRIRSKHRWRLISRLSEGDATVTELANDSGLRTPHASAEIRRMREDGLVLSDLPPGSRGSKIRLTEAGWGALEDDEWSKVISIQNLDFDKQGCCLIFRDESDLLLGFLAPPSEPLVQIPSRPTNQALGGMPSTRNKGVSWAWALLLEKSPRWFDISDMKILDSPPEIAGPELIDAYLGEKSVIGLMRAKLLNPDFRSTISQEDWFVPLDVMSGPPLDEVTYHRGSWVMGSAHGKFPDIRPTQPVAAIIKERLPRSVLLRSARANSLLVADLAGLDIEGEPYPLEALEYWIRAAHPRLSGNERKRRLQSLTDKLSTNRRVKTDESTLRKFRNDWGGAEFAVPGNTVRLVDTRGLGRSAIEALVRWSLEQKTAPLVLEIGEGLPTDLLSEVASHTNLRLVILDEEKGQFSGFDRIVVDRVRTLPWLSFSTSSGIRIPVRLVEQGSIIPTISEKEEKTISPWDILELNVDTDFVREELDGDMVSIISSALSQYPEGDEEWANLMEARYPLAAWIASPSRSRWPRWQRISQRLDHEWLALMDVDHLPIEKLSELADQATDPILKLYSAKITSKLREDPDNLLRSWPAIDPSKANRGAAWLASQFILNAPWLPEESHSDILDWAVEAWLREPPIESLEALLGYSWLLRITGTPELEYDKSMSKIRARARKLDLGHQLNTWSRLFDCSENNSHLEISIIQRFREDLPYEWWAHISSVMLQKLLEQEKLDELFSMNTPWSAALLRPIGEICQAPGMQHFSHPGCSPVILDSLNESSKMKNFEEFPGELVNPVLDLVESLESVRSGNPPLLGRTHEHVGWLAQPKEKWPNLTIEMVMSGDHSIAERLAAGSSGFHPELR